ncbi:MAG TPA: DUF6350 family protein [Pseudonocardia sp.]|uniref:cell division protein PerM n=1 Tax=Pseudonocardia sp. TaxID=60912 RepID=UPI002EDB71E0
MTHAGSREPAAAVPQEPPAHTPADRLRLLGCGAVTGLVLSYLLAVLIAAVAGLTAGAGLAPKALLVAAIPLWLAAHQVPLVVAGAPLGVLPLLPTAAVLTLTAVVAARVTTRLGGRLREDASAVVASLAGAHASVAVLATALPQSPVQATPWAALLGGGLVAAAGAGLGALRRTELPVWWTVAPEWVRAGVSAARVGASTLCTAGSLMLFAALLVAVNEVHARLQSASPTLGAAVGITLLSLCYLPNALIASVSWLAGPGLSIGAATASPLYTAPGLVPPIPLMAAMPAARPPGWTVLVFVLPVLAGLLVGRRCRQVDDDPVHRVCAVAVAAGIVAFGFGLLAALVSGRLAAGPFDPVELPALALTAALLGWIGVPAVAVVLLPERALPPWRLTATRRPPRRRSRSRSGSRSTRTGAAVAGAAIGTPGALDATTAGADDSAGTPPEAETGEADYLEHGADALPGDAGPDGAYGDSDIEYDELGADYEDDDAGENEYTDDASENEYPDHLDIDTDEYAEFEYNEDGELEYLDSASLAIQAEAEARADAGAGPATDPDLEPEAHPGSATALAPKPGRRARRWRRDRG